MEIATARIKIKDHKEEITKIIDDTYLRPSYKVKKLEEGVYEGHAGIIGVMAMDIIMSLYDKNLLSSLESFIVGEIICGNYEEEDYLDGYKKRHGIWNNGDRNKFELQLNLELK